MNEIRVDVAFFGARRYYNVPRLLERAGLLGTFYTDLYLGNKPWLRSALRSFPPAYAPAAVKKLLFKDAPGLPAAKVVSFDILGLRELWFRGRTGSWLQLQHHYARFGREFCEHVARTGLDHASVFYGFRNGCLEIFQAAKRRQTLCIVEQNSAAQQVENQLLNEEVQRWPDWEKRNPLAAIDDHFADPVAQREEAEWGEADYIVCPSEFVISTLESMGVSRDKCRLLPYGIDIDSLRPRERRPDGRGINVLFMGLVGLRKGIPYLLEALKALDSPNIHCRLVGFFEADRQRVSEYAKWVEIVGPVPRSEISHSYEWADVLVLPSISEGSALVTYEALACGIPVITTPNSGSSVRDGVNGFIVPIRDPQALASRIDQLAGDPEMLRTMSAHALECRSGFSSEAYGSGILDLIRSVHELRQ